MVTTFGMRKLVNRVRGTDQPGYTENREDEQTHIDNTGNLLISQSLPQKTEIVRLGDSWQVLGAAWTGLTAVPTTVMIQRLWNGEPATGKSYVIDSVAVFRPIINVTTIDKFTVFAQQVRGPVAAFTDVAQTLTSLSGKPNYAGRARKDTATASSAVSGRWDVIGKSREGQTISGVSTSTAIAGSAWECIDIDLYGLYVVPPGGSFGIHAAEVTATASAFRSCIRWHEVLLPILS